MVTLFIVVAAIVVVAVMGFRQVKRRQTLAAAAAARGWRFADLDQSLMLRFTGHPFGDGRNPLYRYVIRGQLDGYQFTTFEYSFETTDVEMVDNQQRPTVQRYWFWVVALEGFAAGLPVVSVIRKGLMRKLGSALGFTGFQTGDAGFDAAYAATIRGAPAETLGLLLVPAVRAATLAGADNLGEHGWRLEAGALLTCFGGRMRMERIDGVVRTLAAICATFPEESLTARP